MKDFKRLRPFYYGDYYPLTGTENLLRDDVWLAYQLNRPGQGDGIILAFRRKNCNQESLTVRLEGIDPKARYELIDDDSGKKVIRPGKELGNGFSFSLTEKQKSLLISYKKVTN